ncbi:MAG TPA: hypothetical protein PK239_15235 [Chitinophagales bacterium]|nr:hypothetical protein [Chitinophagales bacterium]HRK28625.1 hypothetical protein [Chitinophagales bacterium]
MCLCLQPKQNSKNKRQITIPQHYNYPKQQTTAQCPIGQPDAQNQIALPNVQKKEEKG